MRLPQFEYLAPPSLEEVLETYHQLSGKARLLAGGTDLLVDLQKAGPANSGPSHLISLARLEGLDDIQDSVDGDLRLGALATMDRLESSQYIIRHYTALAQAAAQLGTPLVRNRATLGGNICQARPAADTAPPLLALNARFELKSVRGVRELEATAFFKGPGQNHAEEDEMLTAVMLPGPRPHQGSAFLKLGTRRALEIALVSAAAQITLPGAEGPVKEVRIALGAVAPTPLRAFRAEELLRGKPVDLERIARAANLAAEDARPIDDHRGSAAYRKAMVEVLTRRTLTDALRQAQSALKA